MFPRLCILSLLLMLPLLVVCSLLEVPPPPEDTDATQDFVNENQTMRTIDGMQGAATVNDEVTVFGDAGFVSLTLPNAELTANHETTFVDGSETYTVTYDGDAATNVELHSTTLHLFNVFVPSANAAPVTFLVEESVFFSLPEGYEVTVEADLINPTGTREPLTIGVPRTVFVPNNTPNGEDWTIETRAWIDVDASASEGTAAVVASYSTRVGEQPTCPPGGGGQGAGPGPGPSDCPCNDPGDCPPGEDCLEGLCVILFCNDSAECREDEICVVGGCQDVGPGQSCTDGWECERDLACLPEDFQDRCAQCTDDVPCADGVPCVNYLCADSDAPCVDSGDCQSGSVCDPVEEVCVRGEECTGRSDCAEGETCLYGLCEGTAFCRTRSDCANDRDCCPPAGYVDNRLGPESYCDDYCSQICVSDDDCVDGYCNPYGWCEFSVCGSGAIEGPNEQCDDTDLGGADCVSLGFLSGTLACGAGCLYDTTQCVPPVCNDDVAEGFERCDGTDLEGYGCALFGFDGGQLACSLTCDAFNKTSCTCDGGPCAPGEDCRGATCVPAGMCGNDMVDGAEECDGNDLDGMDCLDVLGSFTGGTLGCTDECTHDTIDCFCGGTDTCPADHVCDADQDCRLPGCGNLIVEDGEQCDGPFECSDYGFDPGTGVCNFDCTIDEESCRCNGIFCGGGEGCFGSSCFEPTCGDGRIDSPEECDGEEFGGLGCRDFGFLDGALGCDEIRCTIDPSPCECTPGTFCAPPLVCVAGDCRCEEGQTRCEGNAEEACISDMYVPVINCGGGCSGGRECGSIPEEEPNDDLGSAQDLGTLDTDTRYIVEGLISEIDPDHFAFALAGPHVVSVETSGDPTFDLLVRICETADPLCVTPIAENDDSGDGLQAAATVDLAAGTYFVVVDGFESATVMYDITFDVFDVECVPDDESCFGNFVQVCNNDGTGSGPLVACAGTCTNNNCLPILEFEPNDSDVTAQGLDLGVGERVVVTGVGSPGEEDWYRFDALEEFYARVITDEADWTSSNPSVGTVGNGPGEASFSGDAGTYFVAVDGFTSVDQPYELIVDLFFPLCAPADGRCEEGDLESCENPGVGFVDSVSCIPGCAADGVQCLGIFETEFNGTTFSANDAGTIGLDQRFVFDANVVNVNDDDFFEFTLETDGTLTLETTIRAANPNPFDSQITLTDAFGTTIATDDDSGDADYSYLSQPGLAAGEYFVKVESVGLDTSGSYSLLISLQSAVRDEARAGYNVFDSSGAVIEGDEERAVASAASIFDFTIPGTPANSVSGQSDVSLPGALLVNPQLSVASTLNVGEPVPLMFSSSAFSTFVTTLRVDSTDPADTRQIPVDLAVDWQAVFDTPIAGAPADGTLVVLWNLSTIENGAVTFQQQSGAQLLDAVFDRLQLFGPCDPPDTFTITNTDTATRLGRTVDAICPITINVEANSEIQIEVAATASLTAPSALTIPVVEVGNVTLPILNLDASTTDPLITITFER